MVWNVFSFSTESSSLPCPALPRPARLNFKQQALHIHGFISGPQLATGTRDREWKASLTAHSCRSNAMALSTPLPSLSNLHRPNITESPQRSGSTGVGCHGIAALREGGSDEGSGRGEFDGGTALVAWCVHRSVRSSPIPSLPCCPFLQIEFYWSFASESWQNFDQPE